MKKQRKHHRLYFCPPLAFDAERVGVRSQDSQDSKRTSLNQGIHQPFDFINAGALRSCEQCAAQFCR